MIMMTRNRIGSAAAAAGALGMALSGLPAQSQTNPLVTGKNITLPPAGITQNVGSLPMNLVTTPDGKFAISSDMGFRQSLWTLSAATGRRIAHLDFNTPSTANPNNGLYYGLAVKANGDGTYTLYASQGANATIAVITILANGIMTQTGTIAMHNNPGDFPAGLALDANGRLYVAVNEYYNGSDVKDLTTPGALAIIDTATGQELGRYSFAIPAGPILPTNYPYAVTVKRDGSRAFVSSQRDGIVYLIDTRNPASPQPLHPVATGSHPVALALSNDESKLYVANAHSDTISVVDPVREMAVKTILLRPSDLSGIAGATPTNLTLSADNSTLYVTLGDMNAVAIVDTGSSTLQGYIPAGWYPSGVVATPSSLLIANAKGHTTRYPNPTYGQGSFAGTYDLNLIEGNVQTIPIPTPAQLAADTQQVYTNNNYSNINAHPFNPVRSIGLSSGKIQHVIYVVKENRTYDQVLGDLPQGNGDAALAEFGAAVTPNLHALASRFVLLDNFYDCGEASGDGWPWSTGSMANENVIKNLPYNYSGRGRNYDFEGQNNGYPAGGFPAKDVDGKQLSQAFPTGLPAINDIAQGPANHIWDAVINARLPYRNYGFFYTFGVTGAIPDNYPAARGLTPPAHDGQGSSDYDYRRFDTSYPDSDAPQNLFNATGNAAALYPETTYGKHAAPSRFSEWNNEFQKMVSRSRVPAFMTVRLMNDHTNGLAPGSHSPRSMVADNDYGVAQLVQAVSSSPIWEHTAIFIIEDDAQDGPDHIDAHRSTCYVISPYIQQSSVDHTFYNTDSVLKTMELLLGLNPMTQYDAVATPILDWSNTPDNNAPYTAIAEAPAIIAEHNPTVGQTKPGSQARRLAVLASKMDFVHPDSADPRLVNEMIWKSIHGMNSTMPAPKVGFAFKTGVAKKTVHGKPDLD